jgi:hypothetical protein
MKFGRATLEDHGTLADSELDAVTGGFIADLVRQSIQLANEAQYQMWVNSVLAASSAANEAIIANIK